MTTGIKVQNALFQYKKTTLPLISGEFHYWRVLRENWRPIMKQIKAMGLDVVASYIPWNYHELEPGKYDFTGKTSPQRDLAGFIDLLREEGLYLIIRPGPYIYAEWIHGGPPARAVKHDRLSPEFLGMAEHYIRHVAKVLVPRQITRGGNIILCQSDNEPYPPVESFGNQIGCFAAKGMFKDWLRDKYKGDLKALNRRWQAEFTSFDDACFYFHEAYVNVTQPLSQRLLPDRPYHGRYADCFEFIGWYAAKIVATIGGYLRDAGMDVPIFGNSWSPLYADFTEFCKVADLAGTDIYPETYITGSKIVQDNWMYNIDIVKMSEADVTNGNTWSAEFQSGIYPIRDVGYLPPQHFKYVPLALMSRGLRGWNWYMLVNRDNWFNCPINEWGRTNEYFPEHQKAVAVAKKVEPWNLTALNDVALFMYKAHRVIAPGNFDETFYALEQGDLSYAYWNPQNAEPPAAPVMLYCGADWLDADTAKQIEAYVRAGGTLVTFSRYPAQDESGAPLKGLPFQAPEGARPTNLPVTVSYRKGSVCLRKGGHCGRKVNFAYFRQVEGEPIYLTLSTEAKETLVDIGPTDVDSFTIGYTQKLGKGRIVYLGSNPSPEILRMVLEQEGAGQYSQAEDTDFTTSVFRRRDGSLVLFLVSRCAASRVVKVRLNTKRLGLTAAKTYTLENAETGETRKAKGSELAEIALPLGGFDVGVWIIK